MRDIFARTSLIREGRPQGPYSSSMPTALWWSWGMGVFLQARYPCSKTLQRVAINNTIKWT